ncbi:DUF58 domain-containing protein [Leucobacter sp. CSA1]|uniref:DUF58 domain-containing protein n=1 Tax=Leucobacter chromiisoli TaxID=2796471 RepID=A0A934UW75_9MICO|nr:DUF58 domain-containing protein [Leucobacter chromiisoli]MBK0420246.1 DUF58 domain-containing protein [Leucobacter chromiisoli]
MIPTRRGWGLLALACVVAAIWSLVRLGDLLALLALIVAALLVSFLTLVLVRVLARPRATVTADLTTPTPGEVVTVTASLWHDLPFAQDLALRWEGPGAREGGELRVPRGSEARAVVEWRAAQRGPVAIGISGVVVADPLGIARCRLPVSASAEVLVLPALLPPEALPRELAGVGSGRTARGVEETGAGRLREYREGDLPRWVHWKQSARQDRLLVNVPEPESGDRLSIALALSADDYPGAPADFEHAVSLTASIVSQHLRRGGGVDLWTIRRGTPSLSLPAASESEILRFLAAVRLEDVPDPSRPRGEEVADRVGSTGTGSTGPTEALEPSAGLAAPLVVTGAPTPALAALLPTGAAGLVVVSSPARVGAAAASPVALPAGWQLARSTPAQAGASHG